MFDVFISLRAVAVASSSILLTIGMPAREKKPRLLFVILSEAQRESKDLKLAQGIREARNMRSFDCVSHSRNSAQDDKTSVNRGPRMPLSYSSSDAGSGPLQPKQPCILRRAPENSAMNSEASEQAAWAEVRHGWQRLYSGFGDMGVSIDWHDFTVHQP